MFDERSIIQVFVHGTLEVWIHHCFWQIQCLLCWYNFFPTLSYLNTLWYL